MKLFKKINSYSNNVALIDGNGDSYSYMMLYKTNDANTLTHTMIISNQSNSLNWIELSPELNLHLINKYVKSKQIKDIPMYSNFLPTCNTTTNESNIIDHSYEPYEVIDSSGLTQSYMNTMPYNDQIIEKDISDDSDKLNTCNEHPDNIPEDNISEDNIPEMILLDEKYEECRIDPYNEKWYTKSEFNNYYQGYIEWDFQEPKKVLLREKINEFTNKYQDLSYHKFIFLFQQYEKTFH